MMGRGTVSSAGSRRRANPCRRGHHSPWLGPLVNLDEDITYTPDFSDVQPD
ncbi:hypothetical protein B0H14DRAFT_3894354, partial [Mycena olivaceomarginata]